METFKIQYRANQIGKTSHMIENMKRVICEEIFKGKDVKLEIVEYQPLKNLSTEIHSDNVKAGWWTDLATGLPKERNVGELLCLVHSEISEAMEGHRKNLPDDKLPHRSMFEVELADAMIRIFDIAGKFDLDLDGAIREKREFNAKRSDHKVENRMKDSGKKY